jgi:2-keto-4-pentenoate hydratase/2-oxohepta-3-ene-1,7-dioic acid hydratase in catechol pathway
MKVFMTTSGVAVQTGEDELSLLDLPHPDPVAALSDNDLDLASSKVERRIELRSATLLAPVPSDGRLFLVGANYCSHIAEAGLHTPERVGGLQVPASAVSAPFEAIVLPEEAPAQVDYEGEIAVVVSTAGHGLAAGTGWRHIAGICVANDVSARDVQLAGMQDGRVANMDAIVRGKSFPTFKPLGPCLLSVDEFRDGQSLTLTTTVNGERRQHATTEEMLFDFAEVVEGISQTNELRPGDVILTGTPAGVGLTEQRFLRSGDIVEISVDRIGTISNTVTDRPISGG